MIITFRCQETEKIFNRQISKKFSLDIQQRTRKKLLMLDSAIHLDDLRIPPANRLEALKGDRKGQHSIRIGCGYFRTTIIKSCGLKRPGPQIDSSGF